MEAATKELVEVLKTMHLSSFDFGSEILCDETNGELIDDDDDDDLEEVVKEAYNNFTSNVKTAMAHLESLDEVYHGRRFAYLDEELGFLRTSFRCLLKWCIEKNSSNWTMNRGLISVLARVEYPFSYLAARLGAYAEFSTHEEGRSYIDAEFSYALDCIEWVGEDLGKGYLECFSVLRLPSNYFMFSNEFVVMEFLDQVLENFHHPKIENHVPQDEDEQIIQNLTEDLRFLRSSVLLSNKERIVLDHDLLIRIEAVGDMAACISYLEWIKGRYWSTSDIDSQRKILISELYNRMGKALFLLLLNSDPYLTTDEFLADILSFLCHYLFLKVDADFQNLCVKLQFLKNFVLDPAPKHFAEPEILRSMKLKIYSWARTTWSEIFPVDSKGYGRVRHYLMAYIPSFEESITELEKTPMSYKVLMDFLDFLHYNLIELPRDYYESSTLISGEVKDELEILGRDLGFIRHMLKSQSTKYSTDQDLRIEIDVVAKKIGSMVIIHFEGVEKGGVPEAIMRLRLSDLLKNIRLMKCSAIRLEDTPLNYDLLLELTDCLTEILKDEVDNGNMGPLKDRFEVLYQELNFLRQVHIKLPNHNAEQEKLQCLTIQIEAAAREMGSVIYSYYLNYEKEENNATALSRGLSDLHGKIMLAKTLAIELEETPLTDDLLMGFVDSLQHNVDFLLNDDSLTSLVNDKFGIINGQLRFWRHFFINYPPSHYPPKHYDYAEQWKLVDVKLKMELSARKIASAISPFFNNKINKNSAMETGLWVPSLRNSIKLTNAGVLEVIFVMDLHRIRKRFPETDPLGFLNFLMDNLKEVMCRKTDLTVSLKDQIQRTYEDLEFFRSYLPYITENRNRDDESKDLSNRISYAAYEAEYLINSLLGGACPFRFRSLWISGFAQQIKLMKAAVAEKKPEDKEINVVNKEYPSDNRSSQALVPSTDLMVGFEDEMDLVKEHLASDVKELDLVSVVGMPGLGKTTLARKVYEDALIVDHFYVRAWCSVSQQYQKREVILTILGSICELTDLVLQMSDGELAVKLHKELMGRRYLIVLDDVWGMDAMDDLKRLFPDNNRGSRIMLTSRSKLHGVKYHLELRLLTDDESWDLLQKKVFFHEQCPWELYDIGKKIAEKCKGLPLAIVVVAGLLAKSGEKRDFWIEVAGNSSSHMGRDSQRNWMNILELSYKHLPDYLRPLFLYMGVFPEDTEIPTKKLIWLWIAEGFLMKKNKLENLEAQAELNLKDLMDRSLVVPAERGSNGRVKTCRMHDLIRDMCLAKAKEENFVQQIRVYDELSDPLVYDNRRLNICPERENEDTPSSLIAYEASSETSIPRPLNSLLFFHTDKRLALWTKAIKSIFSNSKLLRLLHSESTTFDEDLSPHLLMLVHLRYVSVRVSWNSVPSSISGLWNLEILIIKGLRGEIVVPDSIWEMAKLRHLHINDRATFSTSTDQKNSPKLENLESLSTPTLSYGEDKKLLGRLPNLKRLRCIFFGIWDPFRKLNQLPQLEQLEELESLKALYYGTVRHPFRFNLPSSLKKLTLTKFRLQWKDVSEFQALPNLEVLKLLFGAVDDKVWDMEEVEFPKLKYLKLERLNIQRWDDACSDNFPCLEKLILERCKQLEEIPFGLGDIDSLERIEVLWCSRSAAESAKKIQEEQEDLGNPLLKVHVYDAGLHSESST